MKVKHLECTKCGALSGDDWSQCKGGCPVKFSPHFDQAIYDAHGSSFVPVRDSDASLTEGVAPNGGAA